MLARATGRFVPTWLGGITVGVVIRMVVLGHYRWNELAFLAVALVFNGCGRVADLEADRPVSRRNLVRAANQVPSVSS